MSANSIQYDGEDINYDYTRHVWCKNNKPLNGWHYIADITIKSYCHFQSGLLHNKNGFAVMSLPINTLVVGHSILFPSYTCIKFYYYLCGKRLASNISPQEWQEMVPMFEMIRIVEC